ncbi:MAG: GNAT family N-acetyltransferase [Bacteroidia bacterium]
MIKIKSPASKKEFEDYYHLRWKILRKPWLQPQGSEKDHMEDDAFHFIALDEDEKIIGCCRLQMNTPDEAQIRYMAVDDDWQGKGIGKSLLQEAEKTAMKQGAGTIILEAREKAIDFYKQNGYIIRKESYLLFNEIQHYTMSKPL